MSKINALTSDERKEIEAMLKSGMIGEQIAEKTGRSTATIGRIRKELRRTGFDIWSPGSTIAKSIPVANTGVNGEVENDIPTAVGTPVEPPKKETTGSITMQQMSAKFKGSKSGFVYEIVAGRDELVINDEGKIFRIKLEKIESFGEELIDVMTEIMRFKSMM